MTMVRPILWSSLCSGLQQLDNAQEVRAIVLIRFIKRLQLLQANNVGSLTPGSLH